MLNSCYSERKASWQTDKAYSHYPEIVASKAKAWFPCIVTDSNTNTIIIPADDSSDYFKARIDSLTKTKAVVKEKIITTYKDTCKSVEYRWEEGYNFGYDLGYAEGRKSCKPDTILKTTTITVQDEREIAILQNELSDANRKIGVKTTWVKIFAIAGLIGWLTAIVLFLLIRKKDKQ